MDDPSGQIRLIDLICEGMQVVQRIEWLYCKIAPMRVAGR
jgi:hypothetical protein